MGANGVAPGRAAARRTAGNTNTLSGAGAGGDALAAVIGQAVTAGLAPLAAQVLQLAAQAGQQLVPQKTACLYCCARRKMAQAACAAAVAALRAEYEIACQAAADLGDAPPEFTPPAEPELPPIQEMFTWVPVVVQQGTPPVAVPVCYDDLPSEPAAPGPRPTGLVTHDGRPVVAQG